MAKVKAIIFDLGNVVIGFDHRLAVKKILAHTRLAEGEIYDLFFDSTLTQEFEKGKVSPEEFFQNVKELLKLEISYLEFLPIWNEIFFAKPEIEAFIASLEPSLRRVMLSNINKLHYEYILSNFTSAMGLFHRGNVIASYATGFVKPQKEIYELAIRSSGVSMEEIVYVDDRGDLIAAALGYGICAIQFRDVLQLRREFEKLGIIPKFALG